MGIVTRIQLQANEAQNFVLQSPARWNTECAAASAERPFVVPAPARAEWSTGCECAADSSIEGRASLV